ncbi:MAG: hypothetical protein AB7T32_15270 [Dehalococcoidia bacterium]
MHSKASRLSPRTIGGSLAALAVLVALALPGSAWADQTETSTKTINGTVTEIAGDATGSGAIAGPATAINTPIVIQQNIQVDTTGNANNDQTATNDATVSQDTAAGSGTATASNGGTASTGAATATSTVLILQLNIQVITGFVPEAGVSQTASNDADVHQTTVAGSGIASGDGSGSTASSGSATANNSAYIGQINVQIYSGSYGGVADTAGQITQDAMNGATVDQTTAAGTGTATATDGGEATTGDAAARAQHTVNQLTWQYYR